nr:AraC family transcriptional regulator [uncultured Pedobacter sp.]
MLENYYRYFPSSEKDESWGLNILHVGRTNIQRQDVYPPENHPSHHRFSWESGRILQEYALVYIVNGSGKFESENIKAKLTEGSIFLLFPNEKHRYKPDEKTGWTEYWIGFSGKFIKNIIDEGFFTKEKPLYYIGYNETLINLFNHIIEISKEEKSGYQQVISGAVMYILGLTYSNDKQKQLKEEDIVELTVSKARVMFRDKLFEEIDPKKIADELQVGYSWFRKIFKKYTGMAPGQYFIQLKIQKAKELLTDSKTPIKEIAYELKFESAYYFSKLFKQKVGLTPLQYRNLISENQKF